MKRVGTGAQWSRWVWWSRMGGRRVCGVEQLREDRDQ